MIVPSLKEVYKKVGEDLGISASVIELVYKSSFLCTLNIWKDFDMNAEITKEDLDKQVLTFKLGSIARFYPDYNRIARFKNKYKNEKNNKET